MTATLGGSSKLHAGRLLVVCGPSGAGKNTLVDRLLEDRPDLAYSVSATTRPARPGEQDGVDYRFVSEDRFDQLVAGQELLEWAEYAGHRYGTLRSEVESRMAAGLDTVAIVELAGAARIRQLFPAAVTVFLRAELPVLAQRLAARGDEPADVVRRLSVAGAELVYGPTVCEHVVDVSDSDAALAALAVLASSGPACPEASTSEGPGC